MKSAYQSGDPYLAFAKQASAVPQTATKQSHPAERDQYKQCVLATQYGMGAEALAARLKQPTLRARQLLIMHRKVYKQFWDWSDNLYNLTINRNRLNTVFGWQLIVPADLNPRSVRNFPMQANAAEMLRIACILMVKNGIQLCAPIHDAVLIEATEDNIEEQNLDEKISVQARLGKRQAFSRMRGKRNAARGMKLRRASSIEVLKKRAVVAARRAVYQRFLRGRDKSTLSASEKDRVEQQVGRMKYIQTALATRMLPKMRSIEQKRLAGYRAGKSSGTRGGKASKAPGGTSSKKR
jgi:hypothetical protein